MIEVHAKHDGSPAYLQNIVGVIPSSSNSDADTPGAIVYVGSMGEGSGFFVRESCREVLRKMGVLMQWRRDTESAAKLADEALVKAADIARLRGYPEVEQEILSLRNTYK